MRNDDILEAAVTSYRERSARGLIQAHPRWADLAAEDKARVYAETLVARQIEAALDPDGLSSTGRAVLNAITGS